MRDANSLATSAHRAAIVPLSEAIAQIVRDGHAVTLEGFTHLIPSAAGHEVLRRLERARKGSE